MRPSHLTRTRALAIGAITSAVALTATACGGSSAPAASSMHKMAKHSHPMTHAATTSSVFGSDCGMVPSTGMGSLHSMSMDTATVAAMHNPLLSDLAKDVQTAGLTSTLDSMHAITIFAPADSAFMGADSSTMSMLHSNMDLAKILKYHVVNGRITPAELAAGKPLTTLEGATVKPSKMGSTYEVNNAAVTCGNIQTANATIYIINKVLTPMH
jgi:uncharacterized surface protein with fasciclin (FAS1) repeats